MCLAVPGRILETREDAGLVMARVDYAGVVNDACLAYTPEAGVGDWVIVHAGFALQVLDAEEAHANLQVLSELNALMDADREPES